MVTLSKTQLTVSCPLCVGHRPLWPPLRSVILKKTCSAACASVWTEMSAAAAAGGGGGPPGMMSTAGQQRRRSGAVKRRRWGGLRQQWKLLGLFEIDQQHEFYGLTCMMKAGVAAAIQNNASAVSHYLIIVAKGSHDHIILSLSVTL